MKLKLEKSVLKCSLIYWLVTLGWMLVTNLVIKRISPSKTNVDLLVDGKSGLLATVISVLLYLLIV